MDSSFFMKIEIYKNGSEESARIYFGVIPRWIHDGGRWKLVGSTEIKSDDSPRKTAEDFRNRLSQFPEIKPTYYDCQAISRYGIEFNVSCERLFELVNEVF